MNLGVARLTLPYLFQLVKFLFFFQMKTSTQFTSREEREEEAKGKIKLVKLISSIKVGKCHVWAITIGRTTSELTATWPPLSIIIIIIIIFLCKQILNIWAFEKILHLIGIFITPAFRQATTELASCIYADVKLEEGYIKDNEYKMILCPLLVKDGAHDK